MTVFMGISQKLNILNFSNLIEHRRKFLVNYEGYLYAGYM